MNRHALAAIAMAAALTINAPLGAQEIPATPEDGGPRHFEVVDVSTALNLRESASLSAPVIDQLTAGTVLTNLGCLSADQRVWCEVQNFRGGPVGFVDAGYLAPAVGPDGGVATGPDTSALRAGQGDFDATGSIPCAQASGQPMGQCSFGVARAGGGDAAVVITRADDYDRVIFFTRGVAMSANASEADSAAFDFEATTESDLYLIRVGSERYEIPAAVVFGG